MSRGIRSVRGFADVLPEAAPLWRRVEGTFRDVLEGYGYREIRLPLLERTELFARSIGEVTDIVEKEMYTFADRNGDSLTLRPEGTAGCVRACIEHGLLQSAQLRLWYAGPMFRHERPQKGRYRQFYQVGAELFGPPGPDVDAEMILMTARALKALLLPELRLEINSLGTPEARRGYRERLVEYLSRRRGELDEDSLRRLDTNPLRILDSKNPAMEEVIAGAPRLLDHLDGESREHFEAVRGILADAGVEARVNPRLVRGLDYYGRTVFEWITDRLGAQGTVLAGGRYDTLVEQIGGRPTPAIGFAAGVERLVALVEETGSAPAGPDPHAYLVVAGEGMAGAAQRLAEALRDAVPGLRLEVNAGGGSFKSQFRRADRSGARLALVLGESELAEGRIGIKNLRVDAPQRDVSREETVSLLRSVVQPGPLSEG